MNYYDIVLAHNFKLKEFNQNFDDTKLINECYKESGFFVIIFQKRLNIIKLIKIT